MAKRHDDIKDLTMQKPYLSIGEVAAKFGVSVDLLRKWEKAFPQFLHPQRTQGDNRLYDKKDVQRVGMLYRWMRVEGLSIEGVKRRLKEKDMTGDEARQEVIQKLQGLRQQLLGIVAELESTSNRVI